MTSPLDVARTILGAAEGKDHAAIMDYLKTGGVNLDPATAAWCAAFVNSTLQQIGMSGTGSNMARSFLEWGNAIEGAPQPGDIGVWPRGNDPKLGHVGFVESYDPKTGMVSLLAGNQGDAVSVKNMPASGALGFRRADPYAGLPDGPKGQEEYQRAGAFTARPAGPVEAAGGGAGSDAPFNPPDASTGPAVAAAGKKTNPLSKLIGGIGQAFGSGSDGDSGGTGVRPTPAAARVDAPDVAPFNPMQAEQQRQMLALTMQRLNSGRLF